MAMTLADGLRRELQTRGLQDADLESHELLAIAIDISENGLTPEEPAAPTLPMPRTVEDAVMVAMAIALLETEIDRNVVLAAYEAAANPGRLHNTQMVVSQIRRLAQGVAKQFSSVRAGSD